MVLPGPCKSVANLYLIYLSDLIWTQCSIINANIVYLAVEIQAVISASYADIGVGNRVNRVLAN